MKSIHLLLFLFVAHLTLANQQQSWNGQHYQQNSKIQYEKALQFLSSDDLIKYSKIIDVGCGGGDVTAYIAKQAPRALVIGVDISEDMINAARAKYNDIPNVCFYVWDARNLHHFPENNFDFLFSNAAIHWIDDHAAFFHGCATILKTDGDLFVSGSSIKITGPTTTLPVFVALEKIRIIEPWKTIFDTINFTQQVHCLEKETTTKQVKTAGLAIEKIEETERLICFENPEAYVQWLSGWIGGFPAIGALSLDQQKALLSDIIKHIPIDENGFVKWTQHGITIAAKKI